MFWTAGFLVSFPVLIQAPLIRLYPQFSLLMTGMALVGNYRMKH